MHRAANLFDQIHDPENLRLAFHKAARGRRGQAVVRQFASSLDQRIAAMSEAIREGTILKGSNRVNRGGSWNNDAANCRTANRNTNEPTNRTNNNGFRLALNSAGKEAIALRVQTEQIVFQSEQVLA